MNRLEQRLRRLETHRRACNHGDYIVLENPTDEELERVTRELVQCPSCRYKGMKPFVIRHNVNLDE